jgi:tetratricopeptide (TPR) repeat protein
VREYSTREVAGLTGLTESQIRRWARDDIIAPRKDELGRWHYSFQDLALLRTARRLLDAHLSLNRVTRALRMLRAQLPGRPLSAVRIVVIGQRVVVRDRLASWEPESGQSTLDFDVQTLSEHVASKMPLRPLLHEPEPRTDDANDIYQSALDLELAGRGDEAQQAYEAALDRDPKLVGARINLGRLLHSANRLAEAEAMYRAALKDDPMNALAAFNLGVALEDQEQHDAAIAAYRRVLDIDETYADAHFNLSRLLESQGDTRAAFRHLSHFKRLIRGES